MANERLKEKMRPEFPPNDIICGFCKYKAGGIIGFKSAYCDKYPDGKPNEVLFDKAECRFFKEE